MVTAEQPSNATQLPSIPDAVLQIVENLYNDRNELRFVQECELRPLAHTSFHEGHRIAREAEDFMARFKLEGAILSGLPRAFPFEIAVATDLAFQSDHIVEVYDVIAAGEECFDRLSANGFFRFANPWVKLQFVLAAEHYDSDPDAMGLVVGNAWKDGNGQGIMTANIDLARCSRLFENSSPKGLNGIHPAPDKPIAKLLYRGGSNSDTLAHGMSWTEDYDVAKFFAHRQPMGDPVVYMTHSKDNRILARYEHEKEVILAYDTERVCDFKYV